MTFQVNDDLYLTDELKQYYMTDFRQLLAYKKSDFWDIDDGLADVLVKINDSPNLQTIYSKKLTPKQDSFGTLRNSYLYLIYRKTIKKKLLSSLQEIARSFKDEITIEERAPKANPQKSNDKLKGIGCIDNQNYFNVNHLKIELISFDIKEHERFFKELENKLSKL